jgi:predicted nucleic acid-binding protein
VRVVLDTNVALDWLVFRDASARPLGLALDRGDLLLAGDARDARRAGTCWRTHRWQRWAPDSERALASFDSLGGMTAAPERPGPLRCRDPDDQMFIDLAVASARWLLTRDKALLRLARRARDWACQVTTPLTLAGRLAG